MGMGGMGFRRPLSPGWRQSGIPADSDSGTRAWMPLRGAGWRPELREGGFCRPRCTTVRATMAAILPTALKAPLPPERPWRPNRADTMSASRRSGFRRVAAADRAAMQLRFERRLHREQIKTVRHFRFASPACDLGYRRERYGGAVYCAAAADEARARQWSVWAVSEIEPLQVQIVIHVQRRTDACHARPALARARARP